MRRRIDSRDFNYGLPAAGAARYRGAKYFRHGLLMV